MTNECTGLQASAGFLNEVAGNVDALRADRDRLAALNAELVAALADLVADSAPDREGSPAHDRARALIAKAREGKG